MKKSYDETNSYIRSICSGTQMRKSSMRSAYERSNEASSIMNIEILAGACKNCVQDDEWAGDRSGDGKYSVRCALGLAGNDICTPSLSMFSLVPWSP